MSRKPWPMKWIALAMILFVVPYTFLTLRYRKPTSFQPYEDARERKHIRQAGYSRISCRISRPADRAQGAPEIAATAAAGGLPADLGSSLVDRPDLPLQILGVRAPQDFDGTQDFAVRFRCQPPPGNVEFSAAHIYRKERDLVIVVEFAPVADGLVQRGSESEAAILAPQGSFEPGRYQVTLAGSRGSLTWTMQVH